MILRVAVDALRSSPQPPFSQRGARSACSRRTLVSRRYQHRVAQPGRLEHTLPKSPSSADEDARTLSLTAISSLQELDARVPGVRYDHQHGALVGPRQISDQRLTLCLRLDDHPHHKATDAQKMQVARCCYRQRASSPPSRIRDKDLSRSRLQVFHRRLPLARSTNDCPQCEPLTGAPAHEHD